MSTMKTRNLIWLGVSTAVGCGGILDIGPAVDEGAGAAGLPATDSAGTGARGGSAGRRASAGTGGIGHNGPGGTLGAAGEGGARDADSGGAGAGSGGSAGLGPAGSGGQSGAGDGGGGAGGSATCGCTTSDAITLLYCGPTESFGNAYLSADGSRVSFAECRDGACPGRMGYWDAKTGTTLLPHGYRSPLGLSADGRVQLVATDGGVFLQRDGAEQILVPLDGNSHLSEDGSVVAGIAETAIGVYEAARWTATGGVVGLGVKGVVPQGTIGASVLTINADASVLGGLFWEGDGQSVTAGEPYLWSSSGGTTLLGALAGGSTLPHPYDGVHAVSNDGSVAAGVIRASTGEDYVFRYTQATGMIPLGPCYESHFGCDEANFFFSADGSVLAGTVGSPNLSPFRHTEADGLVLLEPTALGAVRGMSSDGSVIFGSGLDDDHQPTTPFVWTTSHGLGDVAQALRDSGADLTGWRLIDALALSKDGKVAVGSGTCDGVPALYRVVLPE